MVYNCCAWIYKHIELCSTYTDVILGTWGLKVKHTNNRLNCFQCCSATKLFLLGQTIWRHTNVQYCWNEKVRDLWFAVSYVYLKEKYLPGSLWSVEPFSWVKPSWINNSKGQLHFKQISSTLFTWTFNNEYCVGVGITHKVPRQEDLGWGWGGLEDVGRGEGLREGRGWRREGLAWGIGRGVWSGQDRRAFRLQV